jgi:Predicted metal-binding integral membrane protein (DUF2182)
MESATIRRPPPLPGLIQLGLIGLLIALAAIAWAVTSDQMSGMDAGPGTDPGTLGFFIGVWVVMMAAMMFPSIAPMVVMHVRIQEGRRERGQPVPIGATTLFIAGYVITWAAAGLVGYGLFQLGKALTGDAFSWDNAGPYLAGGVIVLAAVYQLTPLKDVCLRHCRSPFMFLMKHWRPGRVGAMRMGLIHGGWCVGCCWALMAALFALGVMSGGCSPTGASRSCCWSWGWGSHSLPRASRASPCPARQRPCGPWSRWEWTRARWTRAA